MFINLHEIVPKTKEINDIKIQCKIKIKINNKSKILFTV